MKIIVGLGNYEKKYLKNRHNVGFIYIDSLLEYIQKSCDNCNLFGEWKDDKKFEASIIEISLNEKCCCGEKFILVKPLTFMNNSGRAVEKICSFYKADPKNDLIVIYDDLDLQLGSFKMQRGKSPHKHNGIHSVENAVSTKEFWHIRIGIENRKVGDKILGEDYVLQNFVSEEKVIIDQVINDAVKSSLKIICNCSNS